MQAVLPIATLALSLLAALVIFALPEEARRTRSAFNLGAAVAKLGLVLAMLSGVRDGVAYEARLELVPGLDLLLRVDALSLLFVTLSAFLWLVTTVYAIAYLGDGPKQSRFFGFFSLCVTATTGVALSGTLVTFFIFYEILTLATWPLVVHKGDAASFAAGRRYLAYTLFGSALLLAGIVWLEGQTGPIEFVRQGSLSQGDANSLRWIFALMVAGLGVKAALVPLHGWLPSAMVAPAPVSALLHAVAVVKAGAFGIVRLVYDVYGIELVHHLGLGLPLTLVASATILWGSLRALQQVDIKRRLAYSTVSQVSYIVLGTALFGPAATVGGLVHLVHQGLMKITLFFCAGALAERAGITRIDQLDGAGRRMPGTMLAFSAAAVGMIGLPPVAGFVSKWYLGVGALQSDRPWVLLVLGASALLNAAYFLPMLHRAWLRPAPPGARREPPAPGLVLPAVVTAVVSVAAGALAGYAYSPLGWATLIVDRSYRP
ncbi:complex I subunit 5 family protein [Ramlibacter rhizophilus]|uniref:Monovalent cation/H+ antiporter subunit D family protein n=1 Tax=Ramlibacter rhizophilus TaxID=1781167 RepID=A0A4Z0C0J3_9BURK|nr:proton-conducting transporter membrane subunit [Ramlibacter rhizophilus]TFZ05046.1 monovalent cation/H+ antiporter subunit D family protein [Ramlibacter rhizophilus]